MRRAIALVADTDSTDLVAPQADNDNSDGTFDNLARDVVAILLSDGLKLLAG